MNVREIFEREITTNQVDRKLSFFISEFLKDDKIKDYLFVEFERSPLIPSFTDYLNIIGKKYNIDRLQSEHYSKVYSKSSSTPFEDVVNKLRLEFHNHILNETLGDSFNINDLHRTPLILQLKKIEILLDDLENYIFSKLEDDVNQSKVFADSFFYLIDKIDNQYIKQRLANFILNHNENKSIFCKSISDTNYRMNEDETKWRALKRNFDFHFKELTLDIFDLKSSQQIELLNKEPEVFIGLYFNDIKRNIILEKLSPYVSNIGVLELLLSNDEVKEKINFTLYLNQLVDVFENINVTSNSKELERFIVKNFTCNGKAISNSSVYSILTKLDKKTKRPL